jgi:hypothetical protein
MSDAIRVTTDFGSNEARFNRYLQRTIQISRLTSEQVVRREAGRLVKWAIAYTPPMANRSYAKGFSASKRAIRGSLKLALTARNAESIARGLERTRNQDRRTQYRLIQQQLEASPESVVQFIKRNQKPSKKYPTNGPKHFVTVETRKRVFALLEKTIGATAAGWVTAARALGVRGVPEWITRWSSRNNGSSQVVVSGNTVKFKARNPNRHSDSRRIQRFLDQAYFRAANNMRSQLTAAIANGVFTRQQIFGR